MGHVVALLESRQTPHWVPKPNIVPQWTHIDAETRENQQIRIDRDWWFTCMQIVKLSDSLERGWSRKQDEGSSNSTKIWQSVRRFCVPNRDHSIQATSRARMKSNDLSCLSESIPLWIRIDFQQEILPFHSVDVFQNWVSQVCLWKLWKICSGCRLRKDSGKIDVSSHFCAVKVTESIFDYVCSGPPFVRRWSICYGSPFVFFKHFFE
jgi:hypothetical protein